MEGPELRPTFLVPLAVTREVAIDQIRAGLAARPDLAGRWRGKGRWAEIFVPSSERRPWSPHLSVRVDSAKSGCTLFARFSPDPEIWTLFLFVYFAVAVAVVAGATLAYVQWVSDEPVWAMQAVWIGVPTLVGIHLVSAIGQWLGRRQMRELQELLWEIVEGIEGAPRVRPPELGG